MTRTEARTTINTAARKHTVVVYFTKRDGTERRMVCRYNGAASRRPHLMTVWDMEKGAIRSINLDTVSDIKVLGEDRKPAEPTRVLPNNFAAAQAMMDDLF